MRLKKILNLILALSVFASNISAASAVSDYEPDVIYTIYENNFDSGKDSVPSAEADGYAAQNEFMDFDGILGRPLANSEVLGNMGVRIKKEAWMDGQTFLFDFTKGGTKEGMTSGILSVSFDFSMDEASPADFAVIGANMTKTYEGSRMAYFHRNGNIEILKNRGDWGSNSSENTNLRGLDCSKVYNLKAVIDLEEGKADYYLDDELVKTQTNWKQFVVNNLSISLSGLLDYFDSLKITFTSSEKIQNIYSYNVYENNFDDGKNSVPPASAAGYAAQNEFMDFDGILGIQLEDAEMAGNKGVRVRAGAWMNDRTFLFDFTKGGTKEGIFSGIWTVSFDFSMDEKSTADNAILGFNMNKTYEGRRMFYFYNNGTVGALESLGAWGSKDTSSNVKIDYNSVYNLKTVIDFYDGKIYYYLDGSLIGTQTNLKNETMNNYAVSLSGLLDYFDNLKITAEYTKPIENVITSENVGNIFYEDEPVSLLMTVRNRHNKPVNESVNVEISDDDNKIVWSTKRYVSLPANGEKEIRLYPELSRFGTYFLKAVSDNSMEFTTRLSRSVRADTLNDKVGVCAHFDGRYNLDVAAMFDIISALGAGSVRTDWGCRFNQDGSVYNYDSDGGYFENTVKEANEHGIDILAILGVTVSGNGSDGGFNTESSALLGYQNFCREVAKMLKGKVWNFELGNENNYYKRRANQADVGTERIIMSNKRTLIDLDYVYVYQNENYNNPIKYPLNSVICEIEDKTNSGGNVYAALTVRNIDGDVVLDNMPAYVYVKGADYYKILKAGYDGIKSGNPDALAATSGCQVVYTDPDWTMNRNDREFAESLLSTASANNDYCFDIYAVHPYHTAQAPEIADRWIMNTKWHEQGTVLNELFSKYSVPQEKQKWATEFGYSAKDSAADSSNAKQKAAWIVRTILSNEINGCYDRVYLYDILNDGLDETDTEHNFGTICCFTDESRNNLSAYAAKPQYLALAQYNKMVAGGKFVQNTIISDTIYKSEFKKDDGSIFVVWDTADAGSELTVSGEGNFVKVYDMYGNVIDSAENTGSISVTAGEEPVYVEFLNLKTEIKLLHDRGEVTIVNNSEKSIAPVIFVTVTDSNGGLKQLYECNTYTVDGSEVPMINPGQIAKAYVNTNFEGYRVKVMLLEDLEGLKPMCISQSKQSDG